MRQPASEQAILAYKILDISSKKKKMNTFCGSETLILGDPHYVNVLKISCNYFNLQNNQFQRHVHVGLPDLLAQCKVMRSANITGLLIQLFLEGTQLFLEGIFVLLSLLSPSSSRLGL